MIAAFRSFRDNSRGWLEVDFREFRERLLPLARGRPWGEEDASYVAAFIEKGGGYAVQQLFGTQQQARALLGPGVQLPPPLSPQELQARIRNLLKSCRASGWTKETYHDYLDYLDSDRGLAEFLAEKVDPQTDLKTGTPDHFAAMYRGAAPPFQAAVRAMFLEALRAAD